MNEEKEKKPKSTVGPPIWVESVLTEGELKEMAKVYTTYNPSWVSVSNFNTCAVRWRWRMGGSLLPSQVTQINKRLEELREFLTSKLEENESL